MNEFLRRLLNTDPFAQPRPDESTDLTASVEDIHGRQLEQLLDVVGETRTTRASGAVLIFGKSGTGKSHLLGRLRRATQQQNTAYLFTVQPVAADEQSQLRNMAAAAIGQLTRDAGGRWRHTPLYRMVRAAVQDAVRELPQRETPYSVGESLVALRRLMDRRVNDGRTTMCRTSATSSFGSCWPPIGKLGRPPIGNLGRRV